MNIFWLIRNKLIIWLAGKHGVMLNTQIFLTAEEPSVLTEPILQPPGYFHLSRCEFILKNITPRKGVISTPGSSK